MDLKLIRNLVRLMERAEVTELEIQDDSAGIKVHLKRGNDQAVSSAPPVVNLLPGAAPVVPPPAPAVNSPGLAHEAASAPASPVNTLDILLAVSINGFRAKSLKNPIMKLPPYL